MVFISQVSLVVSLHRTALVAGNGSNILAAYGLDLHGPTITSDKLIHGQLVLQYSKIKKSDVLSQCMHSLYTCYGSVALGVTLVLIRKRKGNMWFIP